MGTFKSDPLSTTYDDAVYALGTQYSQTAEQVDSYGSGVNTAVTLTAAQKLMLSGHRTWVFVEAAADIAAGSLCKRNADTTPFKAAEDAASETLVRDLVGVADHAIASGKYGWIICKGACVIEAEAGVAAGEFLASDGDNVAGEVDTFAGTSAADTQKIVGTALETESSSATFGAGYVIARIDIPS
jgi:hypothetical protein|tara:strand:+ start:767 stop:1324 length:558 start_codon:yes stop_codon:yes gene_type:complete